MRFHNKKAGEKSTDFSQLFLYSFLAPADGNGDGGSGGSSGEAAEGVPAESVRRMDVSNFLYAKQELS